MDESTDTAYREGRQAVRSHFPYVDTFGIGAPLAGLPVYARRGHGRLDMAVRTAGHVQESVGFRQTPGVGRLG